MASDPEGQLSDQSDIPANSEVSEVVINCVVSKDDLARWCGLKICSLHVYVYVNETTGVFGLMDGVYNQYDWPQNIL